MNEKYFTGAICRQYSVHAIVRSNVRHLAGMEV